MKNLLATFTATAFCFIALQSSVWAQCPITQEDSSINKKCPYQSQDFKRKNKYQKGHLAKKLNLSEEQKEQAKTIRKAGREEIAPILNQMREEIRKLKEMIECNAPTEKIKAQQETIKELRNSANCVRMANMDKFESILNPEQKEIYQQIKEERIKRLQSKECCWECKRGKYQKKFRN